MKALEILVRITRTPQDLFRYSDKELDEAIAELEALQQPKSCEGCKYGTMYVGTDRKYCEWGVQQDGLTTVDRGFCCNKHERKIDER